MRHLSSIVLAAAVVAAGAVACFKDPTSGLRNGATRIELTRVAATLVTGDSLAIQAEVKDEAGNTYDAGSMQWTSDNPAVAIVRIDSATYVPYGAFSKVFVRGVSPTGGVAHITATYSNLTATFRVLNLPADLAALATPAVSGTASADTVPGLAGPPVVPAFAYTAGDTVTITTVTGGALTFDSTASTVSFGTSKGKILSRSATAIKVIMGRTAFAGRPWVTNLWWAGPAEVGTVFIDSLRADSIVVARPRFHGTITVNSGLVMTLVPPAGLTFHLGALASDTASKVMINGARALVLSRTATQMVVADTMPGDSVGFTGGPVISNVDYGTVRLDSLWPSTASTIFQSVFPGTVSQPLHLLDTIRVADPGFLNAATSNVVVGGVAGWVLFRSADSILAIAKMPGDAISVTNVTSTGVVYPSMAPRYAHRVPINPTGEANEPANNTPGAVAIDVSAADSLHPVVIYGSVDGDGNGLGADADDFFAFTLSVVKSVKIQLQFAGNGSGGATNPDMDLMVCNATCGSFISFAGATASQPENITLTNRAAGTYNIYVNGWDTGSLTRPYRLSVYTY